MSIVNSMFQFYRVLTGAQEMAETLTDEERLVVVISTWVIIPCLAGVVVYLMFLYSARAVDYLGDKFFPEKPEDAAKRTKTGAAAKPKTSRKAAKKID